MFNRFKKFPTLVKAAIPVLIATSVTLWWFWADKFASEAWTNFKLSWWVTGPLTFDSVLLGLAVLAFRRSRTRLPRLSCRYAETTEEHDRHVAEEARLLKAAKRNRVVSVLLVAAFLVAAGFSVNFWRTHGYKVDRTYVSAIQVTETTAPSFDRRLASTVADASANNNMRDVVGDLQGTHYIGENGTWNALADRRTRWYEGSYEAVQEQQISDNGASADVTFCHFDTDKATRRLGGPFSGSLERAIYHQARGTTFDEGDAYGLCLDGDHPVVVVPLKKVEGWWYAHEVPAGVAVYDGLTGEVKILDEVKPGQLDGPVYPMSLAARTREAAVSLGTWSERNRTGYDETTDSANPSEYNIEAVDGGVDYVTALTPRGSSESIVAESVMASDRVKAGQLNTLVIHKLADPRDSITTTDRSIHADYSNLEWPAGLEMYEITPVSDTEWVATLGMEQKVKYRVRIFADGTSCLEDAEGTKLRCSTDATDVTDTSTTPGSSTEVPASNTELRKLTDAQLVELQSEVTREVLRRVQSGNLNSK